MSVKAKLADHCSAGVSGISHGLSTALDARLELGLETMPEYRLKVTFFFLTISLIIHIIYLWEK